MRIVASVQAKRGSSRGLVHYIAHSKLDIEREPLNVRELFNDFADNLSVTSANNSMRIGIAKGRPSNDELHHIVLSIRPDDYRKIGTTEKQRRRALKETTRAAMQRLEKELSADRLSWAAAVHLNTENPHVHIALQKQYFTQDLERENLTKVPREALPHFERYDGEKVLIPGFLIEAATERMERLVSRDLDQVHTPEDDRDRHDSALHSSGDAEKEMENQAVQKRLEEREILGRGTVAEFELRRIDLKIKGLTDQGRQMRFRVSDPVSGRKTRLSLQDLEQRGAGANADQIASSERQIRTILLKMIGKGEALKERMQNDSALTIREADRVRNEFRKQGRKLPTPSFTKDEIDKLQEYCIDAADIRRFAYLEGVRLELERSREIEPRSSEDLRRIAARKTISDMTISRLEKERDDFSDQRYYRLVDIGKRSASVAQLDREEKAPANQITAIVEKLKDMALRFSGKGQDSTTIKNDSEPSRNEILSKLNEQLTGIENELITERNKAKMLERILVADAQKITPEPVYSFEQLAEIDTLSFRLKLAPIYDRNWDAQRTLIESATGDSPAARKLLKANPKANLIDHKRDIIAGRALAREIIAKTVFDKAKEDLKTFETIGRFHKFAITDKKSGSVEFVSLHEVDLPKRGSKQIGRYLNAAVPNSFVKVAFTPNHPHSLLIARDLENVGIHVNFTATFSARQIVAAVLLANPARTNIFLGRLSQGLSSELLGEQVVLETQRHVTSLREKYGVKTLNMLASVRRIETMPLTAGCDVYTIPFPVLKEFMNSDIAPDSITDQTAADYENQLDIDETVLAKVGADKIRRLYTVEPEFIEFLLDLRGSAEFASIDGDGLYKRFDEAGFGDFFYSPSEAEWREIRKGKLPDLDAEITKKLPLDTLYTLLAFGDFMNFQDAMDKRIQEPIRELF